MVGAFRLRRIFYLISHPAKFAKRFRSGFFHSQTGEFRMILLVCSKMCCSQNLKLWDIAAIEFNVYSFECRNEQPTCYVPNVLKYRECLVLDSGASNGVYTERRLLRPVTFSSNWLFFKILAAEKSSVIRKRNEYWRKNILLGRTTHTKNSCMRQH